MIPRYENMISLPKETEQNFGQSWKNYSIIQMSDADVKKLKRNGNNFFLKAR